jgi:hypothetical protein
MRTCDGDGDRTTKTVAAVTTYLLDTQSPTGYTQVAQERESSVWLWTNTCKAAE